MPTSKKKKYNSASDWEMYEFFKYICEKKNYWMSSDLQKAHKQINLLMESLGKHRVQSGY